MRELGLDSGDFDRGFADIESLAKQCKFGDCQHNTEPGCKVREAIEQGVIEQARFDSYLKLKKEVGYEGLTSKQLEAKKLNNMFKEVGGLKGHKKMVKALKNKKR